jgi:hypothetical protein
MTDRIYPAGEVPISEAISGTRFYRVDRNCAWKKSGRTWRDGERLGKGDASLSETT